MATGPADDHRTGGRPRSKQAHAAIVDATLDLLAEVGYTRLTVEGIAARAGVAKTTVYRRWPTKGALTAEAIGSRSAPPDVEPTGDLRADVRAVVRAVNDLYSRSAVGAALPGVVADLVQDGAGAAVVDALMHPYRDALQRIVRDAAGRGELPDGADPDLLHEVVAGTLLYRLLLGGRTDDDAVDELVGLLLDGLPARLRAPR